MTITPGQLGRILSDVGIIPAIAISHAEVYDNCRIQNAVTLAASKLSVLEVNADVARWRGIAKRLAGALADAHFTWMDPKPSIETMDLARLVQEGRL